MQYLIFLYHDQCTTIMSILLVPKYLKPMQCKYLRNIWPKIGIVRSEEGKCLPLPEKICVATWTKSAEVGPISLALLGDRSEPHTGVFNRDFA